MSLSISGAAPLTNLTIASGDLIPVLDISAASGSQGSNIPASGIASFITSGFAPLLSPNLTGTPLCPTALSGTNTTQIASTAFVSSAISVLSFPVASSGSVAYSSPLATNASLVETVGVVSMTLTGNLTLNVPTGTPKTGQRISYLFTASGAIRVVSLHASLRPPTSVTFDGSIAVGRVRLITLAWTGVIWLVVENLEFIP